jgi:hypothetical protein
MCAIRPDGLEGRSGRIASARHTSTRAGKKPLSDVQVIIIHNS